MTHPPDWWVTGPRWEFGDRVNDRGGMGDLVECADTAGVEPVAGPDRNGPTRRAAFWSIQRLWTSLAVTRTVFRRTVRPKYFNVTHGSAPLRSS
jgi:hypothetical protein